jgi:hypothetical protein
MHIEFWWESQKEREHSGDPDTDGMIVLKWILQKWHEEGMDWIHLAQDRDQWWALMNMVINV